MVSDIAGTTRDAIDTRFTDETARISSSSIPRAFAASAPSTIRHPGALYSVRTRLCRHRPLRRGADA